MLVTPNDEVEPVGDEGLGYVVGRTPLGSVLVENKDEKPFLLLVGHLKNDLKIYIRIEENYSAYITIFFNPLNFKQ